MNKKISYITEKMVEAYTNNKFAVAVVFYDDAKELVKSIIKKTDIDIASIELEPEDWDGYEKEYYISVMKDGLYSEKALSRSGRYLSVSSDIIYIDGKSDIDVSAYDECTIVHHVNESDSEKSEDNLDDENELCTSALLGAFIYI